MSQKSPKKLLFVSRNSLRNAPYYDIVLPSLSRDNWQIDVVAVDAKNSIVKSTIGYNATIHTLLDRPGFRHEMELARILLAARFKDYDVIYLCGHFIAWRSWLYLLGPKFGKKVVYHNTDYFDPITYPLHSRTESSLCKKIDLYINDEYHRAYITRTYYSISAPIIVAPPNLFKDWPIPEPSTELRSQIDGGCPDAFVLMNCGSFTPLRMIPELMTGLASLPDRYRLVLTGGKPKKPEIIELVKNLKLENRITWLPFLDFSELMAYLRNSDAGVMFVANNDLGNYFGAEGRLTQYLACGLPIIASEHAGIESLVRRYNIGECVNSHDSHLIADSIIQLESKIRVGKYTHARIRQIFEQHFAFDHWEQLIVKALNNLLESPARKKKSPPEYPWMPNP
jgi:glycosyltransferase involved in cell wall biosynthesis